MSKNNVETFLIIGRTNSYVFFQGEKDQYVSSAESSRAQIKFALSESSWNSFILHQEIITNRKKHWALDCQGIFMDSSLIFILKKTVFDFAIVDGIFPDCFLALCYKLGISYGLLSIPHQQIAFRVPHFSSVVPNIFLQSPDDLCFLKRLLSILIDAFEHISGELFSPFDFVAKNVPEKNYKTNLELLKNTKLWFYLYHPVINFPQVTMPNVIFVGDLMARQPLKLDSQFTKLLSDAKNEVILVSFGSFLEGIPSKYSNIFFEVFGKLKQLIVMKKPGFVSPNISSNIIMMDWLPQNGILAHKNVKLFVTHCGLNSILEAVYNAVPILGVPFAFDQPFNAVTAEAKGLGLWLKLSHLSAIKLRNLIDELLHNKTYKENAKKMSNAFRHTRYSASQRASFWIKHVSQFGDEHLKTSSVEQTVFEFLMFDIYIFLAIIFFFAGFLVSKLSKMILGLILAALRMLKKKVEKVRY